MRRLFTLIRHAESKFNRNRDCGLTRNGKTQARRLKGNYDIVFVSPLKRCIQTLEYSRILTPKVEVTDLIREFKQSPCDFFEDEEFKKEKPEECLERVNRFKSILSDLPEEYKKIGIISHRDFIWYYTSYSVGSEIYGCSLDNGESFTTDII